MTTDSLLFKKDVNVAAVSGFSCSFYRSAVQPNVTDGDPLD